MSAERRRAEEALARLDRWDAKHRPRTVEIDADDLRSLLDEEEERGITETAPLTLEQYRYLASRPAPTPPAASEPAKMAVDPEDSTTWRSADGSMLVSDLVSQVMDLHPGADRLAVELAAYCAAKPPKRPKSAPPAADEVREAATRYATQPDRGNNGVPYCSEQCPQHDGKRCRILGGKPDGICEPEVLNLLADLAARGGAG